MRKHLLATITLLAVLVPVEASAFELKQVKEDEVHVILTNDRYVAGGTLVITEPVAGDLVIIGGNVTVNSDVEGDVQAAGGTVILRGSVGESVRVAGGNVSIEGMVAEDVIAFGGAVNITQTANVTGDVVIAGGQVMIDGTVGGDLRANGDDVNLGGTVSGNAELRATRLDIAGTVEGDAVLAGKQWTIRPETARINGNARYWRPEGQASMSGVVAGNATFDESLKMEHRDTMKPTGIAAVFAAVTLFSILSAALIIGIMMLLTKTYFKDTAAYLDKNPWFCLLIGFLYFLAVPALAVLFLLSVIGWPIALLLGFYFLIAIVFAKPFTALVLAHYIQRKAEKGKTWSRWIVFLIAIGVYIILKLLVLIPVVGWLALAAAICFAFGTLIMTKYEKFMAIR